MPSVQNTSADILIDSVRVQDKTARVRDQSYITSLQKNGDCVDGQPTTIPYALGDFDALCVSHRIANSSPSYLSQCLLPKASLEAAPAQVKSSIGATLPNMKALELALHEREDT